MKIKKMFCFALLIVLCFSGCSPAIEKLPDTYVGGSDYQYMYSVDGFPCAIQKGNEGYYLLYNDFVWFFDEEEEQIIPLCSKADCLHDKETERVKRKSCNAYASASGNAGISYCNGNLYYIDVGFSEGNQTLYQFSTDGSKKEKLYEWKETGRMVVQWLVHRDVLYYVLQSYSVGEDEIDNFLAMYAMPLNGRDKLKPKQICNPSVDDVEIVILGSPMAYGNYLYMDVLGNREGWEEKEKEGQEVYPYSRTYIYNIQTEEVKTLTVPGETDYRSATGVNFWQDKILLMPFDRKKGYLAEGDFYIANLDGTGLEVFMPSKQGYKLFGDGKYLYLSNAFLQGWMEDVEPKLYRVYDENLKELDQFTTKDKSRYDFPIGNPDRAYQLYYRDSGEWGIMYWDKSEIGSLNGAEIEYTLIPYEGSLPEE